jgi:hypothetical protein
MKFGSILALSTFCVLAAAGVAGAQQAPAVNAPPALAGDKTYRMFADVVTSGVGRPGVQGVGCVSQSVFFPGDTIIFRAVIADGASGTPLSVADVARLGLVATVSLSDGTKVPLHLGSHPPPAVAPAHGTYWAASLSTRSDHPTGTLKWTLTVTDNAGHTVIFEPLGQANGASVLTLAQRAPAPPS